MSVLIETTMRYHFTPSRMVINNRTESKCWWEFGSSWNPVHYWWECKLWSHCAKQYDGSSAKLNIGLSYDAAIALLDIYPKQLRAGTWTDICMQMLIATLFTIVKSWKQPKCPLMDGWINKMWYVYKWNIIQLQKEWNYNMCYNID